MESDNNTENEQVESEVDDEKDTSWSEKEESGADDQEKKKYKCTEPGCNARFLRPSRLERHLRKHNDERPFKCRQSGCTRAYTNSSHLKRHEDTHKNIVKIYECKECLQELRSYASLKRHYKMIHDPQRLRCGMCGAKFRKKHCYDDHMSMHTGVAKYKCEICKAECATLRQFKKHQIIHRKTYRCKSEGCNEVFDNWSKMRKHVTTDHQYGISEKAEAAIQEWFLDGLWGGSAPDSKDDDGHATTT